MLTLLTRVAVPLFTALALLSACVDVGRQFDKPEIATLQLGRTTPAEVRQRFGEPFQQSSLTISDASVAPQDSARPDAMKAAKVPGTFRTFVYFHEASSGGASVQKARTLTLTFWNDRLAFYNYSSSMDAEGTDFDGQLARQIQRGTMSSAAVVALMGQPTGRGTYPMVPAAGQSLLVYHFYQSDRGRGITKQKRLEVLIGADDKVIDFLLIDENRPIAMVIAPTPISFIVVIYVPR